MSDSVGKISLDLELQSDLSKQINSLAGKIGDQIKSSLKNVSNADVSKMASNISNTLKATMDKALSGLNTSIESVFNAAADNVSETINVTKENALAAIAEIKRAATEMMQGIAAMTKDIKIPMNFPVPASTPAPSIAPAVNQAQPRAPPMPKVNTGVNLDVVKAQIDNLSQSLDITNAQIETQHEKLLRLKDAYNNTFNQDRKNKLQEQILKTEVVINKLTATSDKTGFKLADLDKQFEILSNSAKNATAGVKALSDNSKKAASSAATLGSKLKGTSNASKSVSKDTDSLGRAATGAGNSFNHMGNLISRSFQRVFRQVFVIGVLYKAIRGLIDYTGSALMTNAQFVHSLNQIRTNLMVAFMPIYQAVLPALNALMSALATVTAYIATFISAIFGKTYQQSFNAAKGLVAAKAAMGAYGKSAKKAGEEAKGALMGFDEINQLDLDKNKGDDGGSGIPEMVMPDVDVSPASAAGKAIEELAAKTKAVLATIFQPFKNAWSKYGEGVFQEFKRAIEGTKDTLRNLFNMFETPSVQDFIESIARLGLEIGKLFLFIYNEYFLPLLNWLIEKTPFVTELLTPLFNGISNFIEWLMGDGKPVLDVIVVVLGSMFLAFEVVTGVVGIATKVMSGFGAVMAFIKSPIGIVILVIGSLIAIGILLYKNWDEVKAFLLNTWEVIKQKAVEIWNSIKEFFINTWQSIKDIAKDIWNSIKQFFVDTWTSIKQTGIDIWNSIKNFLIELWNSLKDTATSIWNVVKEFLADTWNSIKQTSIDIWNTIKDFLIGLWNGISDSAINIWNNVKQFLEDTWNSIEVIATDVWNSIKQFFEDTWNSISAIAYNIWSGIKNTCQDVFNGLYNVISDIWNSIKGIFNGIIDFIVGVFTGNWSQAWQAVKDIFGSIFSGLESIAKAPLNGIIRLVNGVIGGLNKISLPDWVPGIGGKGINIPKIPMLARGGIIDQPTLSMVGEAGKREAVVPLENNTEWMDKVSASVANALMAVMQFSNSNNSNNQNNGDMVMQLDGVTFARLIKSYTDKENQRIGNNLIIQTT